MDTPTHERRAVEIGRALYAHRPPHDTPLDESWWERHALAWLTADPAAKTRILRFIDLYPTLTTPRALLRHLREYLPHDTSRLPAPLVAAIRLVDTPLATPRAVAAVTDAAIQRIARAFIAGATPADAGPALDRLLRQECACTVDLLGEATLSDAEAAITFQRYRELLAYLVATRATGDPPPEISVKPTSLVATFDPGAPDRSIPDLCERLRPLFRLALENGARITVDMESFVYRDLTVAAFTALLEEEEFAPFDGAGIAVQAYLEDAEDHLEELLAWAQRRAVPIRIRLVKGAYWDQELAVADTHGWPLPVRIDKEATDAAFERMTTRLMTAAPPVNVAIATHNVRSAAWALAVAEGVRLPRHRYEFQTLYGMGDDLRRRLVAYGAPVRVYCPVGEMATGVAYLVRRILENAANESFLRHAVEGMTVEEATRPPQPSDAPPLPAPLAQARRRRTFLNEPEAPLHRAAEREAMDRAIDRVGDLLGRRVDPVIGGVPVHTRETFPSHDPSQPERVVGIVGAATKEMADAAMANGVRAFAAWRRATPEERLMPLARVADILRERRHELAAWQMYEVGKTRAEALGDVAEAIDHAELAVREGWRLARSRETNRVVGEDSILRFMPRGVGAVIAPWNFPMAILAGMTLPALAAGNGVVVKPSSDAPVTASLLCDILRLAGIPDGVVNFLPGPGVEVGEALLAHPALAFVSFTGSWETGSRIVAACAAKVAGRRGFPKVVAEMGGKNALVVDESADLDVAVEAILASAFGYGGQKCSACSRVIAVAPVYDRLAKRLAEGAATLRVGSPFDPSAKIGPLVNAAAKERVERYLALGDRTAKRLTPPRPIDGPGHYVAPTIFGDVAPDSPLFREEIFGPALAMTRAATLAEAIDLANDADFALTAGIVSRTPSSLAMARERLEGGNVYLNRKITGAVVGRHPFGGYRNSGLGNAKGGTGELLRELSLPRVEAENTLRHGFFPSGPTEE